MKKKKKEEERYGETETAKTTPRKQEKSDTANIDGENKNNDEKTKQKKTDGVYKDDENKHKNNIDD